MIDKWYGKKREKERSVGWMVRLLGYSKIMLIWFTSLIWIAYDDVVACFIEWEHTEADYHGVMSSKDVTVCILFLCNNIYS